MITNKGKTIISKYLIGQSPAYASYIAIGCGKSPLKPLESFDSTTLQNQTELDFEMLRVPITSRGYITENGVSKLVLTAQIPAEGRYGITEVGIYPAANNPSASNNDSRMLLKFENNEQWFYKTSSTNSQIVQGTLSTSGTDITLTSPIFATAFDTVLQSQSRTLNNEVPRNGSYALMIPGQMTSFTGSTPSGSNYITLANPGIDLSASSPADKLKIAFSVLPNSTSGSLSGHVKIAVEFGSTDTFGTGSYATGYFYVDITDASQPKRYFISSINISDMTKSSDFAWSNVNYVKVAATAESNSYSIALDGLRVDNVNSLSPLYGLVGYTIIRNSTITSTGVELSSPIVKDKDKTSFVEFRFQAAVI